MKKILLLLIVFLCVSSLTGCKAKAKTFSKIGVSITLDETFVEKEVIQAPFYLESSKHMFMALREAKSELTTYGITSLDSYINTVLTTSGKTATVETYDQDDVYYKYAYYTSTVGDQTFGYMLITMEGTNHFYTMNFGCLESNLENSKELYFKWAKTITVE